MKKNSHKKLIIISSLSLLLVFLTITFILLNIVIKIEIADSVFFIDEFALGKQELTVDMLVGKDKKVPIKETMLNDEDFQKLKKTGKHQITIKYRGQQTSVVFTMYDMQVDDYLFGIVDESSCMVVDYIGSKTSIAIKNIYEGRIIVGINDYAFYQKKITSVYLSPSIKTLGAYAFAGCNNLININLEAVIAFGEGALMDTALSNVLFSDDLVVMSIGVLAECQSLTRIVMPFLPENYLGYLFGAMSSLFNEQYVSSSLQEVVITQYSPVIGDYSYYNCFGLTKITYLSGCGTIGYAAFCGLPNLEKVELNSPHYQIIEDVIYRYDLKELVLYPAGKKDSSYQIINSAETIGPFAFAYNHLQEITFNNVSVIETMAFYQSSELKNINFGLAVKEIADAAFMACSQIISVTFNSYVLLQELVFSECDNLNYIYAYEMLDLVYANAIVSQDIYQRGPVVLIDDTLMADYLTNDAWLLIKDHLFSNRYVPFSNEEYRYLKGDDIVILETYQTTPTHVIPSVIDGLKVTTIGPRSFSQLDIEHLVIGDNVKELRSFSFLGNAALETVVIGQSSERIGEGVFFDCSSLLLITITNQDALVGLHYQSVENPSGNSIDLHAMVNVPTNMLATYQSDENWSQFGFKLGSDLLLSKIYENEEYRYYQSEDGIYLIKHLVMSDNLSDTLEVAPLIDGMAVTKILSNCFINLPITNLYLSSLYEIEKMAFYDCRMIVDIYVPNGSVDYYIEQFVKASMEEYSQKICQIDTNSV